MRQVSLDRLRVFVSVAETGGFSAAARRIGRAQSAVSHAVSELEADFGVALSDRSGWKPTLTKDGLALLPECRAIIAQSDGLMDRARSLSEGIEPELSIAADAFVPEQAITQALQAVLAAFPSLVLRIEVGAMGVAARSVLEKRSAIGVMASYPLAVDGLHRFEVGRVPLVGVVAPAHPLAAALRPPSPEELAQHVQIVLSDPLMTPESCENRDFGVLSKRVWRIADLSMRHRLLLDGLGWANMPLDRVREDIRTGRLVRIGTEERLPSGGRLRVNVVHRFDTSPRKTGETFIQALSNAMSLI